jgi:DNA-binding NtrC family response regulator
VGRELLSIEPNELITAAIDLDEASTLGLLGDPAGGLELATRAAASAASSGWERGKRVAVLNIAQFLVSLGRFDEAEKQIGWIRAQPFQSVMNNLALADTEAQIALCRGLPSAAWERLDKAEQGVHRAPNWNNLTNQATRTRTLIGLSQFAQAAELASESGRAAASSGSEQLESILSVLHAEACLGQGDDEAGGRVAASAELLNDSPLALLGLRYLVGGKSLVAAGAVPLGLGRLGTAERVLGHAGDVPAVLEARAASSKASGHKVDDISGPFPHLDSAVALLELSGHPHILGREAFALIQDASCADAVVLAATGPRGVRVTTCDGWSADEALGAVKSAATEDLIDLGQHRDETWTLLARSRPSLEHRCTLGAIRKLITTARALDQYRRDEKQRAALWPADTLEGDAESLWLSEQSIELLQLARRVAPGNLPILLTGETGTGKEMLARVVHRASLRADRPFVPFNCTAVPREMLESQLFGHRKGSFTGADTHFPGVIRSANGGTLFLDEIGDIGIELQPKLLRFLEHQEVHPLGETHPIKVDVRIVAATNANLDALVAQGRFREDLLYRLKVIPMHLPPLRERREEIPALVQHYLQKYGDQERKARLSLSDETLEYLLLYSWPGNIRQLANEVRRIVALAEPESTVTPALLSPEIRASRRTVPADDKPAEPEIRLRLDQPLPAAVETLEQTLVRHALEKSHGRVEEAARLLGISRKGLFLKRRRWGIQQVS